MTAFATGTAPQPLHWYSWNARISRTDARRPGRLCGRAQSEHHGTSQCAVIGIRSLARGDRSAASSNILVACGRYQRARERDPGRLSALRCVLPLRLAVPSRSRPISAITRPRSPLERTSAGALVLADIDAAGITSAVKVPAPPSTPVGRCGGAS